MNVELPETLAIVESIVYKSNGFAIVIKIEANTKRVVVLDRIQWFLAGMSIALSLQLSQSVTAAVSVGQTIQIAQTNSSGAAHKAFKEGVQLSQQATADSLRGAIVKYEEALKLFT